jgi:hypothetical protein
MRNMPDMSMPCARAVIVLVIVCAALAACKNNDKNKSTTTQATVNAIVLNDTGMTLCADQVDTNLACPVATHPGQDAQNGRDVTNFDNTDGKAGFSFTKLDSSGNALAASATSWDCVLDNVTGLVWEVKTPVIEPREDPNLVPPALNLRADTNTYTWYDASRSSGGGDRGVQDGGECYGAATCDTEGYVSAINSVALCGFTDWRLPSRAELHSIVDYSQSDPGPMLDITYFPNSWNTDASHGAHSDWYWTLQTAAGYSKYAWAVSFNYGSDDQVNKSGDISIRLVRGGP